jgi:regulator of replication initiation timing
MTEEVKIELPVEGEAPAEQEAPQLTEIEQKALDMGWRPREEFDGSDDEFIDAKEFVRRKPLFDKIDHQGRQLKATIKALEGLKNHYTTMREVEYERALKALKSERKQALTDGDGDRFEELDDQIKSVEQQAEQVRAAKETPVVQEEVVHPEFQAWTARNPWYQSTGYMRKFADDIGTQLHARGMNPAEVLKEVEAAVRKEFPQKFTNPNKANAPAVESGAGTKRTAGRPRDEVELSDMERKVMNDLTKMRDKDGKPFMTREQYIADIKKARGIA